MQPARANVSTFRRRTAAERLATLLLLAGLIFWPADAAVPRRSGSDYGYSRNGVPVWENERGFERDVFTFARLRYNGGWSTDVPDADLNLAFRLQQMTSMKVHPDLAFVTADPGSLSDYPLIYMVEPGGIYLNEEEVAALRAYLTTGGFLMADDFWGSRAWDRFAMQILRIFPDKKFVELDITHPIFHSVFDLEALPQMPGCDNYLSSGLTYEAEKGPGADQPHYRAIFDDKGRLMILACHNTDLGDGWEREGDNYDYFRRFSEPQAYPMMINIIFYVMAH